MVERRILVLLWKPRGLFASVWHHPTQILNSFHIKIYIFLFFKCYPGVGVDIILIYHIKLNLVYVFQINCWLDNFVTCIVFKITTYTKDGFFLFVILKRRLIWKMEIVCKWYICKTQTKQIIEGIIFYYLLIKLCYALFTKVNLWIYFELVSHFFSFCRFGQICLMWQ